MEVHNTWAQRCNQHSFMSSRELKNLPTSVLNVTEGYGRLWEKTRASLAYLYKNHLNDFDWFLKADVDTYVIMENLRFTLLTHSPSESIALGCKFVPFVKQGYNSGGAGYVLSREALRRLVEFAFVNKNICSGGYDGDEDVELGKCLEAVGVKLADTTDMTGKYRFIPDTDNIWPSKDRLKARQQQYTISTWYYYPFARGAQCCSDMSISFHKVSQKFMRILDFLIYRIQPYGYELLFTTVTNSRQFTQDEIMAISRNLSFHFRGNDDVVFANGSIVSKHALPRYAGNIPKQYTFY